MQRFKIVAEREQPHRITIEVFAQIIKINRIALVIEQKNHCHKQRLGVGGPEIFRQHVQFVLYLFKKTVSSLHLLASSYTLPMQSNSFVLILCSMLLCFFCKGSRGVSQSTAGLHNCM